MAGYVFQRFELKYLLTEEQYRIFTEETAHRFVPDQYGNTTIQSLYFDTPDDRLIRASLDKPMFKEKLRLRCYGPNSDDRDVYLEMKRKYDGVVYKRRIACKEGDLPGILAGQCPPGQIGRELKYFISYYEGIRPKVMILCERKAFFDPESDLRLTYDHNIRYRTENLSFREPMEGEEILPPGTVLMELKCGTAYPLWLAEILSREKIMKTSFSKYGEAYQRIFRKQYEQSEAGRSTADV